MSGSIKSGFLCPIFESQSGVGRVSPFYEHHSSKEWDSLFI